MAGELFQKGIEVFQLGVFDDDFPSAIVILDVDLQAQRSLQLLLDLANIGIDGRLRLGLLLRIPFWMEYPLNISLSLANRKRKRVDLPRCLLDLLDVLKCQQGAGMPECQLSR